MVRLTLASLALTAVAASFAVPALSVANVSPPAAVDPWVVFAATTAPTPRIDESARRQIFERCELYRFQRETPDEFRNREWEEEFERHCGVAGIYPPPEPVALALATITAGTIYIATDGDKFSGQIRPPVSPD